MYIFYFQKISLLGEGGSRKLLSLSPFSATEMIVKNQYHGMDVWSVILFWYEFYFFKISGKKIKQ